MKVVSSLILVLSFSILASCHGETSQSHDKKPSDSIAPPPHSSQIQSSVHKDTVSNTKKLRPRTTKISDDSLIVPGQSVGKVKLKASMNQVDSILGDTNLGDAAMGKYILTWKTSKQFKNREISIYFVKRMGYNAPPKAKMIKITDPDFQTKNGIGPQQSLNKIKTSFALYKVDNFSRKGQEYTTYGTGKGILFVINQKDICTAIVIQEKGKKESSLTYLPFF